MLESSYQNILIGTNYISLIHAINLLKSQQSVLLIDDNLYNFSTHWSSNIGEIEKKMLINVGQRFEIDCLLHIDNYLKTNTLMMLVNDVFVEFCDSYYSNLKELARKFPESISKVFLKELESFDKNKFDQDCENFINNISKSSDKIKNLDDLKSHFSKTSPQLVLIFDSFAKYLDRDQEFSKQIHYILQVMFQTAFSSEIDHLEGKYLLLSLISPRYQVETEKLLKELIFEFRKLGGDMKSTKVVDWGVQNNDLKFVLLKSIDGLIKVNNTFYYGKISNENEFDLNLQGSEYGSIKVECLIDHKYVEFYQNKRIIFTKHDRMGSDFPFWELKINNGNVVVHYCYADHLGTKPSFYYTKALEDIYQALLEIFPGLERADWISRAKLSKGDEIWVEYGPQFKNKLLPRQKFLLKKLYSSDKQQEIKNLTFCGPERGKSLGFYGYLLDLF